MSKVKTLADLLARTTKNGDCIEFVGAKNPQGYGCLGFNNKSYQAHRLAWELTNGPIPEGFVVCHRCDNPPCINPAHLFLGTQRENIIDMYAKGRGNGKWKFCARGHPLSGDNLTPGDRGRCRACNQIKYEKYKQLKNGKCTTTNADRVNGADGSQGSF